MNQMNHIIQLTAEQFEALQSGQSITIEPPKPTITKWEPIEGKCIIHTELELQARDQTFVPYTLLSLGFQTVDQADLAMKALYSYARQLVWLTENNDGWKVNWLDADQRKYYVVYLHKSKKFEVDYCYATNHLGAIYMSKDNATKLAQLINNGVVEF